MDWNLNIHRFYIVHVWFMQVHDHYTECDIFCTGHGVCFLTENEALAYLWKADAVIYARVIYTCWTKQIMLSMGKQVTTQICMSNWILSCVKKWKSWWQNIRSKNCQQICVIWKEKNDCDM